MGSFVRVVYTAWLLLFSLAWSVSIGDKIENTATATFKVRGYEYNTTSNTLIHTVTGSDATIDLMRYSSQPEKRLFIGQSAYINENNQTIALPPPGISNGVALSIGSPIGMRNTERYEQGETALIVVEDIDQNLDKTQKDKIVVTVLSPTGDKERLILEETEENSGIFSGYVLLSNRTIKRSDGYLWVQEDETFEVEYIDNGKSLKKDSAKVLSPSTDLNVWVEKEVDKTFSSIGEVLVYTITIHNEESSDLYDLWVEDIQSLGLRYIDGSLKREGVKTQAQITSDGKRIVFDVGVLPANGKVTFTFRSAITAGVIGRQVINRAVVHDKRYRQTTPLVGTKTSPAFSKVDDRGFSSNVASALTYIEEELYRSEGTIVGQVYECAFKKQRSNHGVEGVRLYMEDGRYVVTDRNGRYHFVGVTKGSHVVQIDKDLLPEGYSVAEQNTTARHAGRSYSQFVEMGAGLIRRVDFCLWRTEEKSKKDTQEQKVDSTVIDLVDYAPKLETKPPRFDKAFLQRHRGKNEIIWPPKGYIPPIPSTDIAFVHDSDLKAEVLLNGEPVSRLNYEGKVGDRNDTTVLERYKGVDLLPQTNTLTVILKNRKGKIVYKIERTLHVSQTPARAEFVKERSRLVADGKTPPVIAVRFYDAQGHLLRSGITGTFSIEEPYRSLQRLELLRDNPQATFSATDNRYVIDSEGIAYIKLQPTTESGMVTLHFQLLNRDVPVYAWLTPKVREWIMVGFAEGTVGYNTLKGHAENLNETGASEGIVSEGKVRFFAKGRVKGKWLLTLAYDSGKDTSRAKFFDEIDPEKYYTLYNDASLPNNEAPSRKKLYVKLEKETFSILFGDYSTDLTVTKLSRYSRRLTGIKTEYHDKRFDLKAFGAHTDQVFVRDEIRGDGTSGFYRLKQTPLIPFSERVSIEIRDRYRPQIVLESRALQRFRDYEIDYERGTLYFREPIFSVDAAFNPRYIVVDYEVQGGASRRFTYGGRGAMRLLDNALEIGGTFIRENGGTKKTHLAGIDAVWKVGRSTLIRAEYAKSKGDDGVEKSSGTAKLLELEHFGKGYFVRAYFQEQDATFGLGQLNQILGGARRYGLDLTKTFENRLTLYTSSYRDENLATGRTEDVFESRLEMLQTYWSAYMGYRFAKGSDTAAAQQILLGGSRSFFEQRLKLTFSHDRSLGKNEDRLFPTKTAVGVDFALMRNLTLFGTYEWIDSDNGKIRLGRIGTRYIPWSGMTIENTTLSEFYNDVTRIYNTMGLMQQFQIGKHWSFGIGYEKGVLLEGNATLIPNAVTAAGADFDAYRLSISYRTGDWIASINGEYRQSDLDEKYNVTAGIFTQLQSDLALAFSMRYHRFDTIESQDEQGDVRLSLAYRNEDSAVVVLDRLEAKHERKNGLEEEMQTQKIINNLSAHYRLNPKTELALQHGLKYVKNSFEAFDYKGWTHFLGFDLQYDLSTKWMLGLQGSILYARQADNFDYGLGVYGAYNFYTNMLAVAGYNFKGFEDRDFSLQNYRVQGPYIQLKMKIDQDNLKQATGWMGW